MPENELPDFKALLLINRADMDGMLETQANRYMLAVEWMVEAEKEVRDLTQKFEIICAQVYTGLKSQLDPKGKPLTDTATKVLMPENAEYQKAYNALTDAKADLKLMTGRVEAFQHRKTMLKELSAREISGFFGDPKPEYSREKFDNDVDQQLVGLRKNRNTQL